MPTQPTIARGLVQKQELAHRFGGVRNAVVRRIVVVQDEIDSLDHVGDGRRFPNQWIFLQARLQGIEVGQCSEALEGTRPIRIREQIDRRAAAEIPRLTVGADTFYVIKCVSEWRHGMSMKKTNVLLDQELVKLAKELTDTRFTKDVVDLALRRLVRNLRRRRILRLAGKVNWEGDLAAMRRGRRFT